MDKIDFSVMKVRLEFAFRLIGKIFGRTEFPPPAMKQLIQIVNSECLNLVFQHRYTDKISFEISEKLLLQKFMEIVTRHFNNMRKQMNNALTGSLDTTVGNVEIVIHDGMNTLMIEVQAFFEKVEKENEEKEKEKEVSNG
jgi:hypothetical protein